MKSTPAICGIDLGSWTIKICAFSGDCFQVLTNQANFRETPSLVGFTPNERLVGQPALIKLKTNHSNTIRAPHRFLNLEQHPHLLEQQLRHSHVKCSKKDDILFHVEHQEGSIETSAEEVLISLINKVQSIVQIHGLSLSLAYISVPTHLSQAARHSLQQAAQISLKKPVRLVDQWASLAAHYSYTRIKQLQKLSQMRNVLFLNLGYSSFSLSLVQFTQYEARLLDSENLPYSGCKNMDHHLTDFYAGMFQKQSQQNIFKNPKALVKLTDAIQKQRTVLSANSQHHLTLQYLMAEEDLTHHITRQQFQDFIVPVLSDLAAAMASFQARNNLTHLYALQLMGGGSRIPCIQSMANQIFGIELSRTLNQSESVAIGATVFGAIEHKLINVPYSMDITAGKVIYAKWGDQKRDLFLQQTRLPYKQTLNFAYEGPIDMSIRFNHGHAETEMARLKFATPNQITLTLDLNKILSAEASVTPFQQCNLQHKHQSKWQKMIKNQEMMRKIDSRIQLLYQLKNTYETHYYWCKNKLQQLKKIKDEKTISNLEQQLFMAEKWVQNDHHHHCKGTEQNISTFQLKVKEIKQLRSSMEALGDRKVFVQKLKQKYDELSNLIAYVLQKPLDGAEQDKLQNVMTWGQQAYQKMEASGWSNDALSFEKIEEAEIILKNILKN